MTAAEALAGSHDCCDGAATSQQSWSLRIDSLPCPQTEAALFHAGRARNYRIVPIPLGQEGRAGGRCAYYLYLCFSWNNFPGILVLVSMRKGINFPGLNRVGTNITCAHGPRPRAGDGTWGYLTHRAQCTERRYSRAVGANNLSLLRGDPVSVAQGRQSWSG